MNEQRERTGARQVVVAEDETCPGCSGRGRSLATGAPCRHCVSEGVVHRVRHRDAGPRDDHGTVHSGRGAACERDECRASPRSLGLRVGDRFWSQGLACACRVIALDAGEVRFASESWTEPNVVTSVPHELAARHLSSGRWRRLRAAASAGPGRDRAATP